MQYLIPINEYFSKLNSNFTKWFGSSKVKNEVGPIICYHGSTVDIKIFDIDKVGYGSGNYGHYGYGFYFSYYLSEAKIYGDKIYKCYLKIENPFTGTDEQIIELKNNGVSNIDDLVPISIDIDSFKKSLTKYPRVLKFINDKLSKGNEYAWKNADVKDYDILNDIDEVLEYTTINSEVKVLPDYVLDDLKKYGLAPKMNMGFEYSQSLHWITDLGNLSKDVTKVIQKLGYDGVMYGSEIVVFDSTQIKSVENDGSWDIEDPNIFS